MNFLIFVFTAREASRSGHLPRTVLTAEQIAFLRGRTKNADDLDKQFLQLFGQEAEEACRTGTVILGAPRKRAATHSGDEPSDIRELEQLHRIYVPIHVEGFPWIVLLKFLNSKETRWSDTFHHYHDVIPRVAAMLRTEAKALYLDLLEPIFVDEIAKADLRSFVPRFNRRSRGLLRHLPFPHVYLTESGTGGEALDLHYGRRVYIATKPNQFFNPEWTYDPLGGFDVNEACKRAKVALANEEQRERARAQFLRHTLINHFPLTSLEAALAQPVSQLSGKARQHVEDARRLFEMVNVALAFVTRGRSDEPYPLEGMGLAGILKWLEQQRLECEAVPHVMIDKGVDWIPPRHMLPDVFTVLLNLWENAGKHSPRESKQFNVRLTQSEEIVILSFANQGTMPREWCEWLLGISDTPNSTPVKKGLEIAFTSINKLHWNIASVSTEDKITRINITMQKQPLEE